MIAMVIPEQRTRRLCAALALRRWSYGHAEEGLLAQYGITVVLAGCWRMGSFTVAGTPRGPLALTIYQ